VLIEYSKQVTVIAVVKISPFYYSSQTSGPTYKHKISTDTRKMNKNTKVVVSLQGSLENGEIFEQTPEDHPLLLVLGQNNIFPKLEKALEEMRPGESRTIQLAPEEAYGPHHQELVQTLDLAAFNSSIQPQAGMILTLKVDKDGRQEKIPATVLDVKDEKVTIDYNHPLAGKPVVYTLKMHDFPE